MKKLFAALLAAATLMAASPVLAAGDATPPRQISWPHTGLFGTYDRAAAQRGLLVYQQVCSACHGLKFVAFRTLRDIGLSEDEVKAFAAEYDITDGPDDAGDMFDRPGKPSDYFPSPFANDKAAAASNNGIAPPDLSLIVKARAGHENYIYSLLTGYKEGSDGALALNPYFPGGKLAMAAPLTADAVEYPDGTAATVDQMSRDVTTFLAWASEPTLEARKKLGVKVMLFLLVFFVLAYAVKRKVWADAH